MDPQNMLPSTTQLASPKLAQPDMVPIQKVELVEVLLGREHQTRRAIIELQAARKTVKNTEKPTRAHHNQQSHGKHGKSEEGH
jgi:hypothetical protein